MPQNSDTLRQELWHAAQSITFVTAAAAATWPGRYASTQYGLAAFTGQRLTDKSFIGAFKESIKQQSGYFPSLRQPQKVTHGMIAYGSQSNGNAAQHILSEILFRRLHGHFTQKDPEQTLTPREELVLFTSVAGCATAGAMKGTIQAVHSLLNLPSPRSLTHGHIALALFTCRPVAGLTRIQLYSAFAGEFTREALYNALFLKSDRVSRYCLNRLGYEDKHSLHSVFIALFAFSCGYTTTPPDIFAKLIYRNAALKHQQAVGLQSQHPVQHASPKESVKKPIVNRYRSKPAPVRPAVSTNPILKNMLTMHRAGCLRGLSLACSALIILGLQEGQKKIFSKPSKCTP